MSEEYIKSPVSTEFAIEGGGTPERVVEVAGRVKWFDVAKGYGFIVPDNGEADVLIHVTVLRRDGFPSIHEGARVVAEATRSERGMQVFSVLSVAEPDGDLSHRIAAGADPRAGDLGRRLRDRHRQMVQSGARLWVSYPRRGH